MTSFFFVQLQKGAVWEHRPSSGTGLGRAELPQTAAALEVVYGVSASRKCHGCANACVYMLLLAARCPVVPLLRCTTG